MEHSINKNPQSTLGILAFENNPLYAKHRFISSYPVSEFVKTGEIVKKRRKLMSFKKNKCKQKYKYKMHVHSIVVYLKLLVLALSNWVKLKFLSSKLSTN